MLKTEKLREREDKASVKKDRSSQEGQGQLVTKTEITVRTWEVWGAHGDPGDVPKGAGCVGVGLKAGMWMREESFQKSKNMGSWTVISDLVQATQQVALTSHPRGSSASVALSQQGPTSPLTVFMETEQIHFNTNEWPALCSRLMATDLKFSELVSLGGGVRGSEAFSNTR